ncbi:MAG: hypothetical protein K0R57_5795 [Paenibacillaceae bacterium]|nr:hypothetical protein [Paenibacillaceae bacterium]
MSKCHQCPTQTISDPPRVVYRDYYHPQIVEVIHPIEIVNRHHCVPVPVHLYTCVERDEYCDTPNVAVSSARSRQAKGKKGQARSRK